MKKKKKKINITIRGISCWGCCTFKPSVPLCFLLLLLFFFLIFLFVLFFLFFFLLWVHCSLLLMVAIVEASEDSFCFSNPKRKVLELNVSLGFKKTLNESSRRKLNRKCLCFVFIFLTTSTKHQPQAPIKKFWVEKRFGSFLISS